MGLSIKQMLLLRETQGLENKQDISVIEIDGNKISGYFQYFFVREKTYVKKPERSLNGTIDNLNSYATFITPKVKIKFNALSIESYRKIMDLIYSKNEFTVGCFDTIANKWVYNKMYFYPQDYPELFQYKLDILAVLNYEVELVGTNTSLDYASVTYRQNYGSNLSEATENVPQGTEVIIARDSISNAPPSGYVFSHWNTKADGSGTTYVDNTAYTINGDLVLYAIWRATGTYTLSYNYGVGEDGEITSKNISAGSAYGELPTTQCKAVIYIGEEYYPYNNPHWYRTPVKATDSQMINHTDIYNVVGNSTIYQLFDTKSYSIRYDWGEYSGQAVGTYTAKYGVEISAPQTPVWTGHRLEGWYLEPAYKTKFEFTTMPPVSLTLYAKWVEQN